MILDELATFFSTRLPISVSSLTRVSTTVTATTAQEHGYATGETRTIAGATQTDYNGAVVVTVTGLRTFTYTIATTPATPATGTITASRKIYTGIRPATPDNVVWLMEYGGLPDEPTLGTGGTATRLEFPRLQFGARGIPHDYTTPRNVAELGRIAAMTVVNTTLSGVLFQELSVVTPPFFLQRDENNRVEIVMNLQAMKDPSA